MGKGARLQVVAVKQGEESKKVAFIVKILESEEATCGLFTQRWSRSSGQGQDFAQARGRGE